VQPAAADNNRPKAKGYSTNVSHFFWPANEIGGTSFAPLARQASGCFPVGKGVLIEDLGFRKVSEKPCQSCIPEGRKTRG